MNKFDSDIFNVDLNNYQGPLDVLLDLAKSQKVDLENISITKLADQFLEFIKNSKNLNQNFYYQVIQRKNLKFLKLLKN